MSPFPRGGKPEFNLIQAPELVQRLARALGLRQAHVIPTLAETVQPVAIIADVSKIPTGTEFRAYRFSIESVAAVAPNNFPVVQFLNPSFLFDGSVNGTLVRLKNVEVTFKSAIAGIHVYFSHVSYVAQGGATNTGLQTNPLGEGISLAPARNRNSVAIVSPSSGAATFGSLDWGLYGQLAQSSLYRFPFDDVELPPAGQLVVGIIGGTQAAPVGITAGEYIDVTFEWTEETQPRPVPSA